MLRTFCDKTVYSQSRHLCTHTHTHTHTGSNLGVCTTQTSQCCTRAYIDDVTQRAQEFLQNGLREEFEDRIDSYNDIVGRVTRCKYMQYFRKGGVDVTEWMGGWGGCHRVDVDVTERMGGRVDGWVKSA